MSKKASCQNLLRRAQENGYAVPAFNYTDIWEFLAILEAATELNAPVYAASAKVTVDVLGMDICSDLGKLGCARANGNLYNHLDHCTSVARCKEAIDAGYHSVMLDCSALPLEENISKSKAVADYAKKRGVFVEAEVGQILGANDEASYAGGAYFVKTEDCVRMVEETGIDSLAIGIGNQHGFYQEPPKLNIDLLAKVHSRIDIPLVLHGSSGLEAAVIRECIRNGIVKVNVGTELHRAYKKAVAAEAVREPCNYAVTSFALPAKEAIKDVVRHWIKVCGAEGKRI